MSKFSEIDFYKGFKIYPNHKIKYLRINRRRRVMEINTRFFSRLSEGQQFFLLNWGACIKGNDILTADKKAYKRTLAAGYEGQEIATLFDTMHFNRHLKQQRFYYILTEDEQNAMIISIIEKIKAFFLQWTRPELK